MLQWAFRYQKLGLSVIPLKPNGKEPLVKWQEFQKRKASEDEIKEWFKKWPNANLGIVTGFISRIAVVDLDGIAGLQSQKELPLESSVVSLTGNGKHLWYQNPKDIVSNAVRVYPGVDVRGEGGYVVVPPSISPNGRRYRWLTPLKTVLELPIFPSIFDAKSVITDSSIAAKPDGWIAKALEEMKDGNIDNTITAILGRLRHDNYTAADAEVLLRPHMERVNASAGHLEEKIENIWNRYEARPKLSGMLPNQYTNESRLVIHSPANPDSIKQFELRLSSSTTESGIATGYTKLDSLCFGGLKSSRLFTVAARTGVGKTNWLLGAIKSLCSRGKRVLLFSTEMPYEEIWTRYKATLTKSDNFEKHQFYICDSFAPNLEKVEEAVNEIKPDLFMFDHINHVSEEVKGLGEFMQGLNFLKRKYDCSGIVTAQLNRAADWIDLKTGEKVTPRMSMIKGSGTIEQASSRVLLLSETRVTPEGTEIVGNLDKNDNGDKGLIHFMLLRNPYRMVEL